MKKITLSDITIRRYIRELSIANFYINSSEVNKVIYSLSQKLETPKPGKGKERKRNHVAQ